MSSEQKLSPLLWAEKPPTDLLPEKTISSELIIGVFMCSRDRQGYFIESLTEALSGEIKKRNQKEVSKLKFVFVDGMPVRMPNGRYLRIPPAYARLHDNSENKYIDAWRALDTDTQKVFHSRFKKQYADAPERVHFWVIPMDTYEYMLEGGRSSFGAHLALQTAPPTRTVLLTPPTNNFYGKIKYVLDKNTGIYEAVTAKILPIPVFFMKKDADGRSSVLEYIIEHHPVIRKRKQKERAKAIADATERVFPAEIDELIAAMTSAKYRSS